MKSRIAIAIALVGLALSACRPAASDLGTPATAPTRATTSSPPATGDKDESSGASATTTTAMTAPQPVAMDLDADQLTNVLDELDRTLRDLDQSLDDQEGDPLNE
jgi:hypothetical protein